jgi:hypothetical protein
VEKSTIVGGLQASNATKYTMTRYVDTVDCTQGYGFKMTKTHAPLHTDYNLRNFGSNKNSHLGPCESNHIENVKKPSQICSDRRTLSRISFASNYRRRWSWILRPDWWMTLLQGSIPIPNAMILVQVLLDLPLMWQTRHPKEEVKARPWPCPCPFIGFPATRRIIHR